MLGTMFSRKTRTPPAPAVRARIFLDLTQTVVYAVGDVHGCYDALASLESKIVEDARSHDGRKLMIMLGDYVDRGPDTARVLAHLAGPPPAGFERICLAGNHDAAMLDYLEGRTGLEDWLALKARPTLYSYGIDPDHLAGLLRRPGEVDEAIRGSIPEAHVAFLRGLPVIAFSRRLVFVHAGIRPGIPLEEQTDADLMTIRRGFLDAQAPFERWVIHGHTPVDFPRPNGRRLGIDTGVCESGRLTALRVIGSRGHLLFS